MIAWLGLLYVLPVLIVARSFWVFYVNGKLIDRIGEMNRLEIYAHKGYDGHRWREFKAVPHWKKMLQFWRPVRSFHRGQDWV
jgi:hypothetical protein